MTSLSRTCSAHAASHTVSAALTRLGAMIAIYRSRRALAALDADALTDIGLTATEAAHEARRPFWDIPAAWMARRGC